MKEKESLADEIKKMELEVELEERKTLKSKESRGSSKTWKNRSRRRNLRRKKQVWSLKFDFSRSYPAT